MQLATDPKLAQIFFSCTTKKNKDGEQFISQHVLDYIIAGTGEAYLAVNVSLTRLATFVLYEETALPNL
jgi:hypothetical protein